MTMTVTEITYGDIDQDILRDCFDKSLPFLDKDPIGNIIWEEMSITKSADIEQKFEALKDLYNDLSAEGIIFKIDIDGRIVNYNYGTRELTGDEMFCHQMDLMREDASGSQGWSYSAEYFQKINAFFKSKSENCATFSSWVIAGSGMEAAWDKSVSAGHISYTTGATNTEYTGYTYKKLIITVLV